MNSYPKKYLFKCKGFYLNGSLPKGHKETELVNILAYQRRKYCPACAKAKYKLYKDNYEKTHSKTYKRKKKYSGYDPDIYGVMDYDF